MTVLSLELQKKYPYLSIALSCVGGRASCSSGGVETGCGNVLGAITGVGSGEVRELVTREESGCAECKGTFRLKVNF